MTEKHSTAIQPTLFRPIVPSSTIQPKILPRIEKRKLVEPDPAPEDSDESVNNQRLRRKLQNRVAQRAFRERKEKYVKELEDKIKEIQQNHALEIAKLEKANQELRSELAQTKIELTKYQKIPSLSPEQPVTSSVRIPSSAVACIRDKDGVSFCERLKEEVCSNAYTQLLTEPLFDEFGILNDTISPVPIVSNMFMELEQHLNEKFSSVKDISLVSQNDFISCSKVWQIIANHTLFEAFDKEELCDRLRQIAKCSKEGPVFEEREVQAVLEFMCLKMNKQ